jgi:hypothetical protein
MSSQTPYYYSRRSFQPNKKHLNMKFVYFLPFLRKILAYPDSLTHLNPDPVWTLNQNTASVTLVIRNSLFLAASALSCQIVVFFGDFIVSRDKTILSPPPND